MINADYSTHQLTAFTSFSQQDSKNDCRRLKSYGDIKVSKKEKIQDDLNSIRDRLKKMNYPGAKYAFSDYSQESKEFIIDRRWDRFAGSSVWLSKYKVHFVVSRVIYAKPGQKRESPTVSYCNVQIFDKNWNELKDFKIDVESNGYILKFPNVLMIPFEEAPKNMGPEDPRVIVRKFMNNEGHVDEEPIIVFNQISSILDGKRGMHIYKPFTGEMTVLQIEDSEPKEREKNWVPFFTEEISKDNNIHFIYGLDPLEILECDMDSGICKYVFKSPISGNEGSSLRGGTNLVRIPRLLVKKHLPEYYKTQDLYVAFPRTNVQDCSCGNRMYRPHLMVLAKDLKSETYNIEYISASTDLNIKVLSYAGDEKYNECDASMSILIPNSISQWGFLNSAGKLKKDFMTVMLSEADKTNVIVHISGIFDHIVTVLRKKKGNFDMSDVIFEDSKKAIGCALKVTSDRCEAISEDLMAENLD
ncbi:hypothetical protein PACTADRAFT_39066 [Pachysolen tannophilus NRRL Y-2460]|uniref:Uncharacterized protein n=1 Tax=Pachysolen tannophilus NRRL Y-2460 TaxID=669874 RepID=A0A1E4TYW5_PACTA|nr:hypothetical protein PACTADRAFT_39066 [Pachysolen tannophilus NRRL Y-2460]